MLNKPKFMKPSTNFQECTIDVTAETIPFSCIVDGNEAIDAWQIIIYNLNDNSEAFNTGRVEIKPAFFPIDEKNRNVVFSIDLKKHIGDNTTFVNRQEEYYWTITFWGTSGASSTSCQEVFYANKNPEVAISYRYNNEDIYTDLTNGSVLGERACVFKASCTLGEGVYLKRYGWRLLDAGTGQVLIDTITHNQIYGTADNIICSYNGFLNNGKYSVEVYIETQNNTIIITDPVVFEVSYDTTFLSNDFKVEALKTEPAIILDWNEAVVIGGRHEGEIFYKTNYPIIDYAAEEPSTSVEIPFGSEVIFDYGSSSNLDIDENCYIVLSTQLLSVNDAVLFDAKGDDGSGYDVMRKLSFKDGGFEYVVLGDQENIATKTYKVEAIPNQYVWYIIIMSPLFKDEQGEYYTELTVVESRATNGLYPSPSLYPSTKLYPSFGTWDKLREEVQTDGVQ